MDWTDEKSPFTEEVVKWMTPYNMPVPKLEEMEEWEQIGKVGDVVLMEVDWNVQKTRSGLRNHDQSRLTRHYRLIIMLRATIAKQCS